jgi:hypothetical protein
MVIFYIGALLHKLTPLYGLFTWRFWSRGNHHLLFYSTLTTKSLTILLFVICLTTKFTQDLAMVGIIHLER